MSNAKTMVPTGAPVAQVDVHYERTGHFAVVPPPGPPAPQVHAPVESFAQAMPAPAPVYREPADPNLVMIAQTVESLAAVVKPLAGLVGDPKTRSPAVAGVIAGAVSGALFGLVFAVMAVWIHHTSTSGTVSTRLDKQDETSIAANKAIADLGTAVTAQNLAIAALGTEQKGAIANIKEVTAGLLDEGEDDMDWMERALAAGFAGKPIPERGPSGRKALRRKLSGQ
jgi:uncharacterized membrane protein